MKKIVFISSTFVDLQKERKKVWETLEEFQVIVKGMEEFGARSSDPLTTCLSEVAQADIYVGIIGMRYGSIDKETGKSFSQLEYEKAVKMKKEILIYLIDTSTASVIIDDIQKEYISNLDNFKTVLREKHTVDTFSNAQDLVLKLKRQFAKFLAPKPDILLKDGYESTKEVLDDFFLVPALYSGREIKLKIKFLEKPQPASKDLCFNYNFEFGKTIVQKIKVLKPLIEVENFKYILIESHLFKQFMGLDKSLDYEVFAKVLFKQDKVKSLTTDFKDRFVIIDNYEYDDTYDEPYMEVLRPGEGQIALTLKEIVTLPI